MFGGFKIEYKNYSMFEYKMEKVYETRKQQIKKPNAQVYSQKHVRIQEKIKEQKQKQKKK